MHDYRIIRLMQGLKPSEVNEFYRWTDIPFFNRREKVTELCALLRKHYPHFDSKTLAKEQVHTKLFGDSYSADDRRLPSTVHYLTKLLEDYLVWKHTQGEDFRRNLLLIEALENRDCLKDSEKVMDSTVKSLEKKPLDNYSDFYRYFFNDIKYRHQLQSKRAPYDNTFLNALCTDLDHFYFINKLRYAIEQKNRNIVYKEPVENLLLEEIVEQTKAAAFDENAALQIYSRLYYTVEGLDDETDRVNYFECKKLVTDHIESFEYYMRRTFLVGLVNYCQRLLQKGEKDFLGEMLELYKLLDRYELLFQGQYINEVLFLNTAHLGLTLKDMEWTLDFLKRYKSNIKDQKVHKLSMAMYHFANEEFNEVLKLMADLQFKSVHMNLSARSLLVKAFFELNDYDLVESNIHSYEAYLRRCKPITEAIRKANLNFIFFVRKLYKASAMKDTGQYIALKEELDNTGNIAYKTWLLSKLHFLTDGTARLG